MRECAEPYCGNPVLTESRYCSAHHVLHPAATPYSPGEDERIQRWYEALKRKGRQRP